jgi:hypothetical protein
MNKKSLIGSVLIISVIIITLLTVIIPTYSYADNSLDSLGLDDLDDYKGTNPGSEKLKSKANIIFSYLRTIGIVVSVVTLIVIGIKYMMGSVEEKATYKQTLLPYLIGAILLFTGSFIPQMIYDIMQNF